MNYLLVSFLSVLFLPSCIHSQKYTYKDCRDIHLNFEYEILDKERLGNNTFKAHIFLNFNDTTIVTYDMIACSAIEICKVESVIEGYFYKDVNCLRADSVNSINPTKINSKNFFDCYLGSLSKKWSHDWKEILKPSDFEFLVPPAKVKF